MTSPDPLAHAFVGAAVAVVRPGDTLVFAFPNRMSDEAADHLRDEFKAQMPEGVKVCFVDQCAGLAVVRPDVPE